MNFAIFSPSKMVNFYLVFRMNVAQPKLCKVSYNQSHLGRIYFLKASVHRVVLLIHRNFIIPIELQNERKESFSLFVTWVVSKIDLFCCVFNRLYSLFKQFHFLTYLVLVVRKSFNQIIGTVSLRMLMSDLTTVRT